MCARGIFIYIRDIFLFPLHTYNIKKNKIKQKVVLYQPCVFAVTTKTCVRNNSHPWLSAPQTKQQAALLKRSILPLF